MILIYRCLIAYLQINVHVCFFFCYLVFEIFNDYALSLYDDCPTYLIGLLFELSMFIP